MQTLIWQRYYLSNTQKFKALMKLKLCIILKLFLNFSDSESWRSYKLYSCKNMYPTSTFASLIYARAIPQ